MTEPITVVYSASRNLYPYLPVAYMSLLEYNPDAEVYLMIEDDEVPYETPGNVKCVNVSGQTIFGKDGPNSRSSFTYLAMIRAAYPLIFNGESYGGIPACKKLDRIISLDCDTIICDSLEPVWGADLTDKWFGAVTEFPDVDRVYGKNNPYRNAGLMVMNLEQMRIDGVAEKAIDLLNRKRFDFIDEQVLNLLNMAEGDTKCFDLPQRFNEHLASTLSLNPAVVHYPGIRMVWEQNLDDIYRGQYLKKWMKYAK